MATRYDYLDPAVATYRRERAKRRHRADPVLADAKRLFDQVMHQWSNARRAGGNRRARRAAEGKR